MKVFLDGVELKLPELEGVVLLNINSWSSGCSVWSESDAVDDFGPARMDDQMLEVVGLYSSLHVGRIQVSMADPIRLGQARQVKVHSHTLHFNVVLYLYSPVIRLCCWKVSLCKWMGSHGNKDPPPSQLVTRVRLICSRKPRSNPKLHNKTITIFLMQ